MSHTTAETRQTFRCKECAAKDAEIARLIAATLRLVGAAYDYRHDSTRWSEDALFYALTDPVIVALRRE